jgi:type II restriction/modification system DNA methylase subunit YeeA
MDSVILQENLENLSQSFSKEAFIFDLLSIYEIPKSTIKLLKTNQSKLSGKDNEIILKNKLFFHKIIVNEDEHFVIDALQKDKNTYKYNPRFIIVTDYKTLLAVDTKTNETLDISINDLGKYYAFFLPWMGMEKAQHTNENPADIRAAYKMDKLYQAIVQDNPEYYKAKSHDLNVLLSRLLFCFFAEDTSIFSKGLFTNSITSHTQENGEGLDSYFESLFDVLNTKDTDRTKYAHHFTEFPYVNGGLFEKKITLPVFTTISRKLIIECGKLGWDSINPDIFGSMIQAVVHPGQRESLGMHYTSVPNIMQVIEPLFLDELNEVFENVSSNPKGLNKLRERISKIRIFDPACGSGNFLIIAYRELCRLEARILKVLSDQKNDSILEGWSLSSISLNNFFGIEIDDFAHEIARLSLYLAQHQINLEFQKEFGKLKPILPLKESGHIVCGNSIRLNWEVVCPQIEYGLDGKTIKQKYEIYIIGNPPYLGSRNQEDEQKEDLKSLFLDDYKSLDYISAWFYKGAKYIKNYENTRIAFVSTNSISQGLQVSLLWPRIFKENVEICFAHQSFKWKNLAKENAGVTCVIIGLSNPSDKTKKIYFDNRYTEVKHISPYLVEGDDVFIYSRTHPLSEFPDMNFGNMPADGGKFLFTEEEENELLEKEPTAKKWFRKLISADEFLNGQNRYCLWWPSPQISYTNLVYLDH